jgi:hypothetical protein
MQKAGTGWLYDAFNNVDGFTMLPIKEFNHFSKLDSPRSHDTERRKKLSEQMAKWRGGSSLRDRWRLYWAIKRYINAGFSTDAYLELFDKNRDWLTGDITPSYSVLTAADVAKVHDVLPDIPVFLILRHPVDRAWSAFNMHYRRRAKQRGHRGVEDLEKAMSKDMTVDTLVSYLANPSILARSKPSEIHDAWSVYGDNLIVVGLQDIIQQPKKTIERLVSRVANENIELPANYSIANRKAVRAKIKMTEAHRDCLYSVFAEEISTCKQRYPEIAANWHTA